MTFDKCIYPSNQNLSKDIEHFYHPRNSLRSSLPTLHQFSSVQSLSHVRLFATPWIAACQASLFEFTQTHVDWVGDAIQPSHPLSSLLLLLPIPPSIRVFSNESTLPIRWPKYWSFSFSIIPSKEHPGPISFRMDWLDLLAVQGTVKSLLKHHSSKVSILWRTAFFTVQLSHPYIDHWKNLSLDWMVPLLPK